ncbi:hypothetical protein MMC26_004225 [Xylographa opegraphella]|nr:hypothetical protein [Xylographa opegraphella]
MAKVIGFKENVDYVDCGAIRVIVTNQEGEIVIVVAPKGNYYKLPGRNLEADEYHRFAVEREAMAATGCKVTMEGVCMAATEEWRDGIHRTSYCYRGRLVQDTRIPERQEDRMMDSLIHEWISVDHAIEEMKASRPTSQSGRFSMERDLYFVETYAGAGSSLVDSHP